MPKKSFVDKNGILTEIYYCLMCGEAYPMETHAQDCETNHEITEDRFYIEYSRIKTTLAAQHPEQRRLNDEI